MPRGKKFKAEQIIGNLREAEIELARGKTVPEVIARAGDTREYCRLPQTGHEARFDVDHVFPLAADGPSSSDNLALACVSCPLRKGARQSATDPQSKEQAPLFNPRAEPWEKQFLSRGAEIVGLTPIGRTTVSALKMNRLLILAIRVEASRRP